MIAPLAVPPIREWGGTGLLFGIFGAVFLIAAAGALAELVTSRRVDALLVERINGVPVLDVRDSPVIGALTDAGFSRTPRGLRLR